ncbi:MAG: thermonuclease family protein [Arcobacteraceae bacterium]|jgi:endonuclease YncB( thermonuclease family)|nr:thermonuclease family protein [Arcobacteraceae bacterium]
MKLLIFLVLPFMLFADAGTLVKVVDGDTLHFKTNNKIVKCRIQYIDTPESSDNAKNERDIANCKGVSTKDMASAGKSATRAAQRLLTLEKEYSYKVDGKDRYGRSICVVKMGESTFNEQMILNGFAVPYRQYMNKTEKNYYNILVSDAKARNSGLWKDRGQVIECLNGVRN